MIEKKKIFNLCSEIFSKLFSNKIFYLTLFALLISSVLVACSIKKRIGQSRHTYKKSGYYYVSNKKTEKPYNSKSYINTNISSVTLEEMLFLEDIELRFQKINGINVAVGRKIYTQNKLTSELLSFDRRDLMGETGLCRAKQMLLIEDLEDDGVVNGSAGAVCVKNKRVFSKGKMKFEETSYVNLE